MRVLQSDSALQQSNYNEIYLNSETAYEKIAEYRGIAKVFRSGRSQAVRLPAACRLDVSEVEVVKEGDRLTLRPRGKNWSAYFESDSRGSLPTRREPPLDARDELR